MIARGKLQFDKRTDKPKTADVIRRPNHNGGFFFECEGRDESEQKFAIFQEFFAKTYKFETAP
jgi:hypothetical protein